MPDITAIRSSGNLYAYCNNNPIVFSDPNGEIPVLVVTIAAGAVIGAAVSGGANILAQGLTKGWDNINVKEVGVSMLGGAASGALAGSGAGAVAVIAGNAAIGAGAYAGAQAVNGEEITLSGLTTNAVVGAFFGAIGGSNAKNIKELKNIQHAFKTAKALGLQSGQKFNKQLFIDVFVREARASFLQGMRDEAIQLLASKLFEIDFLEEDLAQMQNMLDNLLRQ